MLKRPATPVPRLRKPELNPLTTPLTGNRGGRAPVTPVLKNPEIRPSFPVPPLAVLKKPDMFPLVTPPEAVLKKPELPKLPVFPNPECVAVLSVVAPKPVLRLPEFQKPVLVLPELPSKVLVLPELFQPVFKLPELPKPVLKLPALPIPVFSWPTFPMPKSPVPVLPMPMFPKPELPMPMPWMLPNSGSAGAWKPELKMPTLPSPELKKPMLPVPEFPKPMLPLANGLSKWNAPVAES